MIVDAGMREMLVEQQDVFYCITLMNENYANPDLPEGAADGVLKGGYRFGSCGPPDGQRVTLVGSGAIFAEVVKAAEQLARQGVGVDVFSITNWSELARDGVAQEAEGADAYVTRLLPTALAPLWPQRTMCVPYRRACAPSCHQVGATPHWVPTDLATATRVQPCDLSSKWMPSASWPEQKPLWR